jgi:PAT family beta-lactamase induction signal transducer AmpG
VTVEPRRDWRETFSVYRQPPVVTMLFLGFSAGLPFLLVFSTLTAWLRSEGVAVAAIGFFSWIGILYSIKFFWAPVVDRLPLPMLTRRLGQRRGWMLLGQLLIMGGLAGLPFSEPVTALAPVVVLALLVAFGSATQDIAIDAFRIESAPDDIQAANAATYMIGYRIGLVMAGAVALYIADFVSWTWAYLAMAALVSVGVITVLVRPEPEKRVTRHTHEREQRVQDYLLANEHHSDLRRRIMAWLIGAVVCPFVDFFSRYGKVALALLVLIGIYRISDISMAAMANPLYLDLGFSLSQIGTITNVYGIVMTITGGLVGGLMVTRYGIPRMLVVGAALTAVTNLLFAVLATIGAEVAMLVVTISADNLSNGFASTILIAFMSSLTSRAYTATQYALFSSLMTLPGKFVSGFSGVAVEAWGYPWFFIAIGIAGVPAVLLAAWYAWSRALASTESPDADPPSVEARQRV